jgi:hypothetical protein
MATTYFMPTISEPIFASVREFPFEPIFESRPAISSTPKMKIPGSVNRSYTESELSSVAKMLDRLRKRADVVEEVFLGPEPMRMDQDRTLDLVVEKLMDRFE